MWGLLIILGLMVAVFVLCVQFGLPAARRRLALLMAGEFSIPERPLNPLLWIEVLADDRIRLFVPKAEMGQGAHTGLAQIAAEELEVPLDRAEVTHATTHQGATT